MFHTVTYELGSKESIFERKKALDLTLKQGDCHIVVEGIYLLSDK